MNPPMRMPGETRWTRENALDYLHKTHARFIPDVGDDEASPGEEFIDNEASPPAAVE
jgi:hypothetical protein